MTGTASWTRRALTAFATISVLTVSTAVAPAAAGATSSDPAPAKPPAGSSWKEITSHARGGGDDRGTSESLTHPHPSTSTCSYNPGAKMVSVSVEGVTEKIDANALRVGGAGAILLAGAACEGATVNNTDRIIVTGTSSEDDFIIDLRGGPFAPGAPLEPSEISEIKFSVNLGGADTGFGFMDVIGVLGNSGADRIVLGQGGMNLNRDADADVLVGDKSSTVPVVFGRGGNDLITAHGGFGTGRALRQMLIALGGRGADRVVSGIRFGILLGGAGVDRLTGGPGGDLLIGQGSNDVMKGGGGRDFIMGGAGNDRLIGGARSDLLMGGRGRDLLRGGVGNDELIGGPGIDTCRPGPGRDELDSCER